MKKVGILSKTVCQSSETIIKYFSDKNYPIDCVIIENNYRKKYSKREIEYRKKHDKFNRKTKKYSLIRRLARRIWDLSPHSVKKNVEQKIYFIPFLNKLSIRKFCEKNGINVFEVSKHSSEETKRIIEHRNIDYLLLGSSNWLLKEPIISMDKLKIINAHSGRLPKHRGLDSIPWSLKENDKIGLTTHFIDSGIDSGCILKFYEVQFAKGDDFNKIKRKVGHLKPKAYYDSLVGLEKNEITPRLQNDKFKPHAPMSFEELWDLNKKLMNKDKME